MPTKAAASIGGDRLRVWRILGKSLSVFSMAVSIPLWAWAVLATVGFALGPSPPPSWGPVALCVAIVVVVPLLVVANLRIWRMT